MLIISKFHDYYDTAIAFGVDKTIVYERKEEIHERKGLLRYHNTHKVSNTKFDYIYQRHIIGFAGKLYPIVKISKQKRLLRYDDDDDMGTKFFYNEEELNSYLKKEEIKEEIFWSEWDSGYKRISPANFFSNDHKKYEEIFIKHKTPSFLISNEEVVLNPTLKDYKFAKVKDPYTAFQDIMQYISGVLGVGEPNTVDISNNDMRDKKGFDDWSFKTHASDSKKPRKRKR